jgi:hypothetical protein
VCVCAPGTPRPKTLAAIVISGHTIPEAVNIKGAPHLAAACPTAGYVMSQQACVSAKCAAQARPRSSATVCSASSVDDEISFTGRPITKLLLWLRGRRAAHRAGMFMHDKPCASSFFQRHHGGSGAVQSADIFAALSVINFVKGEEAAHMLTQIQPFGA